MNNINNKAIYETSLPTVYYYRGMNENRYLPIKGDTVTINFNITLDIDDSILEEIDKLEDIKPN